MGSPPWRSVAASRPQTVGVVGAERWVGLDPEVCQVASSHRAAPEDRLAAPGDETGAVNGECRIALGVSDPKSADFFGSAISSPPRGLFGGRPRGIRPALEQLGQSVVGHGGPLHSATILSAARARCCPPPRAGRGGRGTEEGGNYHRPKKVARRRRSSRTRIGRGPRGGTGVSRRQPDTVLQRVRPVAGRRHRGRGNRLRTIGPVRDSPRRGRVRGPGRPPSGRNLPDSRVVDDSLQNGC